MYMFIYRITIRRHSSALLGVQMLDAIGSLIWPPAVFYQRIWCLSQWNFSLVSAIIAGMNDSLTTSFTESMFTKLKLYFCTYFLNVSGLAILTKEMWALTLWFGFHLERFMVWNFTLEDWFVIPTKICIAVIFTTPPFLYRFNVLTVF